MYFYRAERLAVFVACALMAGVIIGRGILRGGDIFSAEAGGDLVTVHVAGAVSKPGFYRVARGVSPVGAARKARPLPGAALGGIGGESGCADGEVVYVPRKGEDVAAAERGREDILRRDRMPRQLVRIDLNRASRDELASVPGIGEKTAEAIMLERARAPFRRVAGLTRVPGIGGKKLRRIRDYITVAPPGSRGFTVPISPTGEER